MKINEMFKKKIIVKYGKCKSILLTHCNHVAMCQTFPFLVCFQISRQKANITDLQTLVKHKDDSSKAYRERTDAQVS